MSRNGSGTYSLPVNSWNPATNGVSATPADWQSLIDDVEAALTQSVSKDGQTTMTGNLPMGGFKLTGLAAGAATGQSLRWEQLFAQGTEADIASATTTTLGTQNSNFLRVTGTTTITSFGTTYNGPRFLRFADALILTHSSTLVLPTAANITTVAGDTCVAIPGATSGTADKWVVVAYQRASGAPMLLTDGSVTAAKLASDAVTTVKILDANVTTAKIADDAVSFAKMQNIATARLLGRTTASSGDVEELTVGAGLSLAAGALTALALSSDTQQFDSSGTWTKPSGFSASALVIMEAWGTGGGGGNGPGGSGGGGGGYIRKEMLYSEAASSYAITIVAGAINTAGGNTTVGSILTAYGGGRGRSTAGSSGGGGGGAISAGSDGTSSAGAAGAAGGNGYAGQGGAGGVYTTSAAVPGGFDGGGGGGAGAAPTDSLSRDGARGCYGGGGGGGGGNSTNQAGNGANSYWGGAGGAGDSTSGTDGSAGTSINGGAGGAVNTAGAAPGGGGGGGSTGGAGGAGRVIITVTERT